MVTKPVLTCVSALNEKSEKGEKSTGRTGKPRNYNRSHARFKEKWKQIGRWMTLWGYSDADLILEYFGLQCRGSKLFIQRLVDRGWTQRAVTMYSDKRPIVFLTQEGLRVLGEAVVYGEKYETRPSRINRAEVLHDLAVQRVVIRFHRDVENVIPARLFRVHMRDLINEMMEEAEHSGEDDMLYRLGDLLPRLTGETMVGLKVPDCLLNGEVVTAIEVERDNGKNESRRERELLGLCELVSSGLVHNVMYYCASDHLARAYRLSLVRATRGSSYCELKDRFSFRAVPEVIYA